jgi:hypothetical protein
LWSHFKSPLSPPVNGAARVSGKGQLAALHPGNIADLLASGYDEQYSGRVPLALFDLDSSPQGRQGAAAGVVDGRS